VLSGLGTDERGDLRTSYPVNLIPVPYENELSRGYLRPAEGIVEQAAGTAPGVDRGGHVWNGEAYRVLGTSFCRISAGGVVTVLGTVANDGLRAQFDNSFDKLAIASGGTLFYWDGATLTTVTDTDLGRANDVLFVDGYFMTTDGTSLVVTELNDPFAVDPLKYGSAEQDPDRVQAVLKVRNEPVAVGRFTLEFLTNVGGDGFPFQRVDGALVKKGAIGTNACCVHSTESGDAVAFVGSGKNEGRGEPPSVYVGVNGSVGRIATQEIDTILQGYTEGVLAAECVVESRVERGHEWIYVHLPDRTLVYDNATSRAVGEPVWFVLTTTLDSTTFAQYAARSFLWCYDKWLCADPTSAHIGYMTREVGEHYGDKVWWGFDTALLHNRTRGGQINELELVALNGRVALDADPIISTQHSIDGLTWSNERQIYSGRRGQRNKRLAWRQLGNWRSYRIQRFRGDTQSFLSFLCLEVTAEGLTF
jgi:hypothetical protein